MRKQYINFPKDSVQLTENQELLGRAMLPYVRWF